MKTKSFVLLVIFVVLSSAACIRVQHYQPLPLSAQAGAARLEARTLSNPTLRKFLEKDFGRKLNPWPPRSWNLRMLSLAALDYSPALQQARAQVNAAKAAEVTAGERPNPTFRLQPGIPSPYLLGLDFLFSIQTAGKRKIMVKQARALAAAARLKLALAAWKARSNVRAAMVSYFLARRKLDLLRAQQRLQERRVMLLRQRLSAGEISRPQVANARLSALKTQVAMQAAQGRISQARAALAAAVGVPVAALRGVHFAWPDFGRPPGSRSFPTQQIQRDAVLNRLDVHAALAQYAAAQDALQLQIARQHPNFQIGPGYQFEEGNNYFTVGYSVTLPVFNRNQGPIAQARAQRKAAAAAFLAAQANAIAQSEEALANYRAAMRELKGTQNALRQLEQVVVPTESRTVAAGEADQLALNAVLLQRPLLAEAWLAALGRAQQALGALEDSVQRPLEPGKRVLQRSANSHNSEKRVP